MEEVKKGTYKPKSETVKKLVKLVEKTDMTDFVKAAREKFDEAEEKKPPIITCMECKKTISECDGDCSMGSICSCGGEVKETASLMEWGHVADYDCQKCGHSERETL